MSTRSATIIRQTTYWGEQADTEELMRFYRHCDGYPEGHGMELAHLVAEYVSADQCEGCVTKRACNAGELDMCWIRKAILEKLRELGVEVDG